MRMGKTESRGTARPFAPTGFTLVELLVVILIIMLLAVLLMPTINTIVQQGYAAASANTVRKLHDGATLYRETTRFLPGEKPDPSVPGTGAGGDPRKAMQEGDLTGSQVLAACLFNISYDQLNLDFSIPANAINIDASKAFTTFKPEDLLTYSGKPNAFSDSFPKGKAKPICYFLSRDAAWMAANEPGVADVEQRLRLSQFRASDNAVYLTDLPGGVEDKQEALEDWVSERRRTPNRVFNDGGFILIAAGLNRKFITPDVENPDSPGEVVQDDIANDYGGKTP